MTVRTPPAEGRAGPLHPRWQVAVALAVTALVSVGLALALRQPWQHLQKVLSAPVPGSHYVIELWEKPYWRMGLGYEYETWFVVKPTDEGERWYLVDDQYITFRDVVLLMSSDRSKVRVETNGQGTTSHMIAEYDFRLGQFRAVSEASVMNTPDWAVFSRRHIH